MHGPKAIANSCSIYFAIFFRNKEKILFNDELSKQYHISITLPRAKMLDQPLKD